MALGERRTPPTRRRAASSALTPGDVPKVVVGSRAEAKAVRAAALNAQKEREAAAKSATRAAEKARTQASIAAKAPATTSGGAVHWTITDAVAALSLLFVLVVAKEAVLNSQVMSVMPAAGLIAARAVVLGLFYALLVAGLVVLSHRHGSRLLQAFGLVDAQRPSSSDAVVSAVLVVLLLFATRLFSTGWGALAQQLGWAPPGSGELTAVFGVGGFGLLLSMVVVVIAAPLIEELVFRGVVLRAALDHLDLWPAVALTAALFALSHATAWTFVPTLVLGLAAGWLTARRGSLWPAIALHVLYNGVVVAIAYYLAR